ncbi:S1 family peptidase [Streptomyces sp. AcE210]|uniref:S1 family peptidase n=1 Tax=Streptomyces sp. AcE210 TaxID=2292703 RepID=UPI000E302094|nr:S1 family peptidase [Streptomyces sp. AcE210]RFC70163.1 S1 family peptidase [Streptomyces sp. AcE210]
MRHARRTARRITRLAAVGGLLCGSLLVTRAIANEPGASGPPVPVGERLVAQLGAARTAGSWLGADGRTVVAVTDAGAAADVRRAGARAEIVRHSMRDLRSAAANLRAAPRVSGTAWSMDYGSNEVVVRADSTVSASDWSRLAGVARAIGGSVRMERTRGTFTTRVDGGSPIFASDGRCSAGFDVTDGRDAFLLTAGHCGPVGTTWFARPGDATALGTTVSGTFPGNDFSLVRYGDGVPRAQSDVVAIGGGRGVRITGAADPVVGQRVFRSGSTTGLHSGRVTGLNATVNYPEGTVTGLVQTTVCAEPGDSGGPLFADGLALGLTSGGNGNCDAGGTTFFQPVEAAMTALGVRLAGTPGGDGPETGAGSGQARPGGGDVAPSAPPTGSEAGAPGEGGTGTGVGTGTNMGGATDTGSDTGTSSGTGTASGTGPIAAISRVVNTRSVGPGLLVIGGSLIALVAARSMRSSRLSRRERGAWSSGI